MKKRILALLLAVCVACAMLILPASASGSNTAVQTAVTLGGLTSDRRQTWPHRLPAAR